MSRRKDMQHSMLIVSGAEQFDAIVRQMIPSGSFMSIDTRKSASAARRSILERYYDIVVINSPLPDAAGIELALDISEECSAALLVVVPRDLYEEVLERVTDCGVFVLSKPFARGKLSQAIRFLLAAQDKVHRLETKVQTLQEKMEELRIISQAKVLLVEREHMTEDDAHRLIGKQAMDLGLSRRRVAEKILEEYE